MRSNSNGDVSNVDVDHYIIKQYIINLKIGSSTFI